MALARAITYDLHGGNRRLANEFNPGMATVGGLLPRWEAILGTPHLYGDTQAVRQARVAAAFGRLGVSNGIQAVVDQVSAALGPLYGGITNFSPPDSALWPGLSGSAASVSSVSGSLATITGLSNVASNAAGQQLTLSNANNAGNNGSFLIHNWISTSSVQIATQTAVAPDSGIGGVLNWAVVNPQIPWTSMICQMDILALVPNGYYTTISGQNVPNAAWWARVSTLTPILDAMLPAWMTWQVYINNSGGVMGFKLDDPSNLDVEVFGT